MILMNIINQSYTKSDSVINLRNGMEMILREGVKRGNLGNTEYLKRALRRISGYDGYSLTMQTTEDMNIDGKRYKAGAKATVVMEGDHTLFVIYKDKNDRLTKLHVNPFDLMKEKDLKNKFEAETKAMMMQVEWKFQDNEVLQQVEQKRGR